MTETNMPAAEAQVVANDKEIVSYELAFHVLPTVAEGEVTTVFDAIKQEITKAGGTLGLEETPKRFDLAYEITKMIDGKYRRFQTASFGWVRFTATPDVVTELMVEVEALPEILRALLVKLTKAEEAHPFYFHDALQTKRVSNVDAEAPVAVEAPAEPAVEDVQETEEATEAGTEEVAEAEAKTEEDAK